MAELDMVMTSTADRCCCMTVLHTGASRRGIGTWMDDTVVEITVILVATEWLTRDIL